jgi:hypothetical protein
MSSRGENESPRAPAVVQEPVAEEKHEVPDAFPKTQASLLHRAVLDPGARQALAELYYPPVREYYRRKVASGPNNHEDAELELTHGFLCHFFLEDEHRFKSFSKLPPPRPRFRAYVLSSAGSFLVDEYRKDTAKKRSSSQPTFSLNACSEKYEPLLDHPGLTPEQAFDLTFALDRLWRAYEAVIQDLSAPSERGMERDLLPYLDSDQPPLERLARRYQKTTAQVRHRWNILRADRELIKGLTNAASSDQASSDRELARRFEMTLPQLQTRRCRLRTEVKHKLAEFLENEFEVADPQKAAEEVARLLADVKALRQNKEQV